MEPVQQPSSDSSLVNAANRSMLLTTMSHEFRTPLGIILGYAELLSDEISGSINETQRKQVQGIQSAGKHLLRLVEEILTISQIDAGHSEVRLEQVNLSDLVQEAAALLTPMAETKRLTLTCELPKVPIMTRTDPGKFRQIVFNLAANAVKFTKRGTVQLSLQEEGGAVMFRVRDTGAGITPADTKHLFESFWQVPQHNRRTRAGTGLGLTITRALTKLLGGEVSVRSELGQGSTFTVRMPRSPAPA